MNDLMTIRTDGAYPIDGRELHETLEVGTHYKDWFPRMCEYGFAEGVDFCSKMSETSPVGGRPAVNHSMTLGMAKEICMLQRTEKGREVRRYLIAVEEKWNQPEAVMARALQMADARIKALHGTVVNLEDRIAADAPKVLFADSVAASEQSILVGQLAKFLCQNGVEIGQNRLFERMRRDGYLCAVKGERWNMPTQRAVKMGLLEIKERRVMNPDGSVRVTLTPKVTGKGQIYFINRYGDKRGE